MIVVFVRSKTFERLKKMEDKRNNPNITKAGRSRILGISTTAIDNNISFFEEKWLHKQDRAN